MIKDIDFKKVEDLAIAIIPGKEDGFWDTYLLNFKETAIRNVLINSKGYGELDGEPKNTSVLRHYFEEIGPMTSVLIEPIPFDLVDLTNEFWVSFSHNGYLYDKKYVFVIGSISEMNFTKIPLIDMDGVMIQ